MSGQTARAMFAFESPDEAIAAMVDRLDRVTTEAVSLSHATGRVLAQPIRADRPSPACDVSAMDGYAVRLADLSGSSLPVEGEGAVGASPPAMPTGAALRVFTGGPVPEGCDAVIPREQVVERAEAIALPDDLRVKPGQHIRRRGENGDAGETVIEAGRSVDATAAAALATFGIASPRVYRRVRLAAIVTGNEVHDVTAAVEPWQLRDGNGPALAAMFEPRPWIRWQGAIHVTDEPDRLRRAVSTALTEADALLLTGGVSMGDYDFVPATLAELGCEIIFHKLPIRPGKPMLGAVGPDGQAILGLPGNPVSVMTTARRIAAPVLRHLAGYAEADTPPPVVRLVNPDDKRLALHWSRPVRRIAPGRARLIATRGSGDIISASRSDGFVEVPANESGPGPWPYFSWSDRDG